MKFISSEPILGLFEDRPENHQSMTMEAMKPLVARLGVDKVKRLADLLA